MSQQRSAWLPVAWLLTAIAALAWEWLALRGVWRGSGIDAARWHFGAGLLVGVSARLASPDSASASIGPSLLAAVVLAWTLPGVGVVGVLLVALAAWLPARSVVAPVLELEIPRLTGEQSDSLAARSRTPDPVPKAIADVLRGAGPVVDRLAAVAALRRMASQQAVPLLKLARLDPNEEVRLLAHASLEQREQRLRRRIDRALPRLDLELTDRESLLRQLACDHWELAYAQLVSGTAATHALERVVWFGRAACLLSADASTALLVARAYLMQGDPISARDQLSVAEAFGAARSVCAPLYAEAAFLMRRFVEIPRWLACAEARGCSRPRLGEVTAFWRRPDATGRPKGR